MTQKSYFWTTNGTGDGTVTGYSQDELRTLFHAIIAAGNADAGVVPDYKEALLVSKGTAQYLIGAGMAVVYGFMYHNSDQVAIDVVSPIADTRIDRVVLRADWAAQTVRIAVLTGEEGGGATPLTQIANTLWEIPLAQISVAVGGAMTITDQREFLGGSEGTPETSDATPLTLVLRDANARAKIGAPAVASDIARKDTVDNHAALTGSSAHGATSAATANSIITRDADGRAQVAAPSADADIARLDTVLNAAGLAVTTLSGGSVVIPASWTNNLTLSGIVARGPSLMIVIASVRWDGASTGSTLSGRLYYDGASYSEEYHDHANNGVPTTTTYHFAVPVAAGTHSVLLQLHGETPTVTARTRRMTCIVIPTMA